MLVVISPSLDGGRSAWRRSMKHDLVYNSWKALKDLTITNTGLYLGTGLA